MDISVAPIGIIRTSIHALSRKNSCKIACVRLARCASPTTVRVARERRRECTPQAEVGFAAADVVIVAALVVAAVSTHPPPARAASTAQAQATTAHGTLRTASIAGVICSGYIVPVGVFGKAHGHDVDTHRGSVVAPNHTHVVS